MNPLLLLASIWLIYSLVIWIWVRTVVFREMQLLAAISSSANDAEARVQAAARQLSGLNGGVSALVICLLKLLRAMHPEYAAFQRDLRALAAALRAAGPPPTRFVRATAAYLAAISPSSPAGPTSPLMLPALPGPASAAAGGAVGAGDESERAGAARPQQPGTA